MSIRTLVFCALASVIVACGADPPDDLPGRDGGADAGDGGQDGGRDGSADVGTADVGNDAGPSDTGGSDATASDVGPSVPIVDRPSSGAFTCRVERGRTSHSPKMWGNGLSLAVTSGGAAHFARLESSPPSPFDPAPVELLVSTFAANGTFGAPVEPSVGDPETMSTPVLTPKGDGTAMAWIAGPELRFATLSAVGQPVIGERSLPAGGTIDYQSRPRIAAGPASGVGIVYSVAVGSDRAVRFMGVDATGIAGSSVLIGGSGALDPAAAIAAAADGYAVVWRDAANNRGRISFSKVGPTGAVIVAPTVISGAVDDGIRTGGGVGFDRPTVALLADGDGYLVAWPESGDGDLLGGSDAWSQIRVARLDAQGGVVVPPTILRTRTLEFDEVEPTLVHVGSRVAVLWGRGEHIYFCGGCYPDNRIDLLMIDPVTLDPVSNLVTLDSTGGGGLMRREVAVLGSTLLVAYLETFHVHSTAGSATFVCD